MTDAALFPRHSGTPYVQSKGKAPGSKHWYKRVYSGSRWDEFLAHHTVGSLLQVCCGGSVLGLARVDLDPAAPAANVRADMLALPFSGGVFDTVACDPIYQMDHPRRIYLQRELGRVARQRVIFKAPWIPRIRGFSLTETWLIGSHTCANVAVMAVLDRRPVTMALRFGS